MRNLNFDRLPKEEDLYPSNEPGIYTLRIIKAEKQLAKTSGSLMLQCDYETVGLPTNFKINYDNYVIEDAQGNPVNFGLVKLRKLLEAINVIPQGEFDIAILPPLIIGKVFRAKLDRDRTNPKYLRVVGTEIYPITALEEDASVNTTPTPTIDTTIEITDDADF
jgi:hypothetical protein